MGINFLSPTPKEEDLDFEEQDSDEEEDAFDEEMILMPSRKTIVDQRTGRSGVSRHGRVQSIKSSTLTVVYSIN